MQRLTTRLLCLLMLLCAGIGAAHACTAGACVSVGPRLASVNTANGALLNALLGNLTGSNVNLSLADYNALASGNVGLGSTLGALQTQLGVSSPTTALNTTASLGQVLSAAASAATANNNTSLATALNDLKVPLTLTGGGIKLGDLLTTDGNLGNTSINALELVTGAIQLYNAKNVVATPTPVAVSTSALGISGLASAVSIAAEVVAPPVFVCGPTGSAFHSATMRLKLSIDLLPVALNLGLLNTSAQIGHLDLYLEVAQANGTIGAINAITGAFTAQVTPGVASLYLGVASNDATFFNRTHVLAASDFGPSTIGAVTVLGTTVSITAKAAATGTPSSATTLNFTGPYPQGFVVTAGASFVGNLLTSLAGNLQVNLTTGLGTLGTNTVLAVLAPLLQTLLPGIVQPLVDGLVNPLLETLGIGLGEVDVSSAGTILLCSISGTVYEDANHSGKLESPETGTGTTLYAKLVPAATPSGPATAVATVDPASGAYSFANVTAASYLIVVNTSASTTQVTGAPPTGWIATEVLTLSLPATISTADLSAQRFGLYHGGKLGGTVFTDNGLGGGTANNGLRDGTEAAVVGGAVRLTDSAGTTVYDQTTSGDAGAYTLWIPFTAGAVTLKVTHPVAADRVAVSGVVGSTAGSYTQATATVAFTNVVGSVFTGVNFGDVPVNRLEPDGQQQILPGDVAFFAHSFTAGSAGQVTISATGNGAPGWSTLVYLDSNCNGKLDPGESLLSTAQAAVANQKLCVIVKVSSPATAAYSVNYPVALAAHWTYANNALVSDHARSDVVVIGSATDSGLRLTKGVDKATALSGDLVTYTLTYANTSDAVLTSIKVFDATPAYTVFSAASCGTMPSASITCAISASPSVGAAGRVEWTFTGSLGAGATGSLTFSVVLQ